MRDKYIKQWTEQFSEQMDVRLQKREKMLKSTSNPYKNQYKPSTTCKQLNHEFAAKSKEELEAQEQQYSLAGRAMLVRDFGKACFIKIDDGSDSFQVYVKKGQISDEDFEEFKLVDHGDILFTEGKLFKTNKGELTILASSFKILSKSIRPLPEKFHGLTDPELRYRMRYVDMIMNPDVREKLKTRSDVVRYIREFFYKKDYLEVETPMMHAVAGGAAAKPFTTHHNTLDMELYLRIAPELHLKRLIVGGYPRVFEMNRCFRNEGLSIKHNPEFTTIEFYQAYATYEDLMNLTEELISGLAKDILKTEEVTYGDRKINLANKFKRLTLNQAICEFTNLNEKDLEDSSKLVSFLKSKEELDEKGLKKLSLSKLRVLCFEEFVEEKLIQPTFITQYPTEVSPLARRNDTNPEYVDRFELFINGWEVANAFSELNNPTDQLDRFADQAVQKDQGDEEACEVDYDYVRALEYGMPPTAGEGIGIDRLTMILTNSASIRDVLLFPLLKKEKFFD